MVERVQIKSEDDTRAMESQERYSLEQLGFKDHNWGLDTLTSVHSQLTVLFLIILFFFQIPLMKDPGWIRNVWTRNLNVGI